MSNLPDSAPNDVRRELVDAFVHRLIRILERRCIDHVGDRRDVVEDIARLSNKHEIPESDLQQIFESLCHLGDYLDSHTPPEIIQQLQILRELKQIPSVKVLLVDNSEDRGEFSETAAHVFRVFVAGHDSRGLLALIAAEIANLKLNITWIEAKTLVHESPLTSWSSKCDQLRGRFLCSIDLQFYGTQFEPKLLASELEQRIVSKLTLETNQKRDTTSSVPHDTDVDSLANEEGPMPKKQSGIEGILRIQLALDLDDRQLAVLLQAKTEELVDWKQKNCLPENVDRYTADVESTIDLLKRHCFKSEESLRKWFRTENEEYDRRSPLQVISQGLVQRIRNDVLRLLHGIPI